jgi:DNA-binding NarL/FixJ family response regulator
LKGRPTQTGNFEAANSVPASEGIVNTDDKRESPIKIYLFAQNRLVREVIVRMLRKRADFAVVGANHDATQAIEELALVIFDVLLIDSLDALRAVGQKLKVAENLRRAKIVLFGMEEDPESFLEAVRLGISGYLPNDASSAQMIAAVKNVMQGEAICPPKLCKSLFEHVAKGFLPNSGKVVQDCHTVNDLTYRQRQLMALVAKGMTNKEIALTLHLSQFTVKNHIRRVMAHLRADTRHHAVDVIRTEGLSFQG